ncbi:unnamed protein product, partial [Amoebophrya sp. A25]|eukprot:GSA25T00027006001.1
MARSILRGLGIHDQLLHRLTIEARLSPIQLLFSTITSWPRLLAQSARVARRQAAKFAGATQSRGELLAVYDRKITVTEKASMDQ